MRLRPAFLSVALLCVASSSLHAQIRGGGPSRPSGTSAWWLSGGAVVANVGLVSDGESASQWDFGGDPRWQMRGTLEKAIQPTTTLGIGVNFGAVDLQYRPLPGAGVLDPAPGTPTTVVACQTIGCAAQVDLWGIQGVLRGGGASEGLYQVLEITGGVTGFRNMRAREDAERLPAKDAIDLNVGLGYGLGFALSSDFHVAFVQDFGLAWHRGTALPDGVKRTYQTRNSRITLRYGLGSFSR